MQTQNAKRQTPIPPPRGVYASAQRGVHASACPRGFTMMELMVAVSILVIIILAVGVTFSGASKSVGMSQATMEEMSGVRETQKLILRDIQGLDRNGFLVIRTRLNNVAHGERSLRFDQISFLANGHFPNRSGANTAAPFTDSSVAGAAHITWSHGVLESAQPRDISYLNSTVGQGVLPGGAAAWQSQLPTGVVPGAGAGGTNLVKENECALLRHPTLLFPEPAVAGVIRPAGNNVMAYDSIDLNTPAVNGNEGIAHITSSRYSTAAMTPAQIMQHITGYRAAGELYPEYTRYSYRFRALDSIYDTEVNTNPFVNGYFRSTPIVMRAVSSFRVEWTDGSVFPVSDALGRGGQLKWYGPTLPSGGLAMANPINGRDNTLADPDVEIAPWSAALPPNAYGDHYVALFSYVNKAKWPKALRISMHVANDRIGGRDFTQVIDLPQ